mgnify:FL=1
MILSNQKFVYSLIVTFFYFVSTNIAVPANSVVEVANMKNLLKAIRNGQWQNVETLSENVNEPAAKTFVTWMKLREGIGSFEDYFLFLTHHKDWPGLRMVSIKGESKITEEIPPEKVVEYFEHFSTSTGYGSMRLIKAYVRLKDNESAKKELVHAWTKLSINKSEFEFFLKKNSEIIKPLINTRIDFLLWNGMVGDANLLLKYLSKDRQRLVRARLALLKQDYGVDLLIKNIPANLKLDAGLAYDRFLWRAKKGRSNDAIDILKQQSLSGSNLKYPNKWSRKRRDYVRQAMRDNQPELAYFLASNHFLTSGSDYADLEWLAGYISLRKLKKPAQAIVHLNNFLNAVKTPISLGRAGYWLGRAYEASDNKQLADYYYRLGAQYQISFYGQLSAERIGAKFDRSLVLEEANPVTSSKFFESSDIFRIALLLYHSGEVILAKRFFLHFAIYLNANDHRQLATYLLNIESDFLALSLAKQAASYGKVYSEAYFPLHKLANSNWKIDGDILLAVARRESEFNPKARSAAGARGLMQIMPATAKQLTSNLGYKYSLDRLGSDWQYNLELGAEYLDHLLQRYDGSLLLSFGAYNAGPTRMDKWIKRYGDPRNNNTNFVDWIEHIPFNETRNYIMRVLEGVLVYRAKLYYEKNLPVEIRLTNFD